MRPEDIKKAVVVGTGMMGPGIAYALATAGCAVTLLGRTRESVDKGIRSFRKAVDTLIAADCITKTVSESVIDKISGSTDLESAIRDTDLVIESIVEDVKVKQELFSRIESGCPIDTILTSNTSGLPATELAGVLQHPDRFAVTHFWNPPHLMPLVEVVKGESTSIETVETLAALLTKAGKKPVKVLKDTPGQLGNRLFHALIREAYWIVQEGIASAGDVDSAIKNGLGRRFPVYGALEHQDLVGLDMVCAIQDYMCKALCSEREPAKLLRDLVSTGDLGAKTGKGVYDWTEKSQTDVIEQRDRFLIHLLRMESKSSGPSG